MMSSVLTKSMRMLSRLPQRAQSNLAQTNVAPTKKLFKMDPTGLVQRHILSPCTSKFVDKLHRLYFASEDVNHIVDVGCGPGVLTKQVLPRMFPNANHFVGIDVLPNMIEYAEKHNPDPMIEYKFGDIEEWDSIKEWKGVFSRLIAVDSLQWVQDQRLAFENIYNLLQFGGEAAIYMSLQCLYFDAMEKIRKDVKWSRHLSGIEKENFASVPHLKGLHRGYYEKMAEEMGFTVITSEEKLTIEPFPHDQACRNYIGGICGLMEYIPDYRREEFKDDLFWYVVRENGRSVEGRPLHIGATLEFVISKTG